MDITLKTLETTAQALATERNAWIKHIDKLDKELNAVKARHWAEISAQTTRVVALTDKLHEQVRTANPALFAKPRTHNCNGIEFGLRLSKPKLNLPGINDLVPAIQDLCPDQMPILIQTVQKPIDAGFKSLATALPNVFKELGGQLIPGEDGVIINFDKVINQAELEPLIQEAYAQIAEKS